MRLRGLAAIVAAVGMSAYATPALAQSASSASGATAYLPDSVSPFGASTVSNADAQSVEMPKLAFTSDGTEKADFDKYYVFHRADTDFATAYADLAECDGYARGLQSGITYSQVPYPYAGTMAGAVGGAIGNAMAMAIFGSAEKRRLRRINMRTCMNFKGYDRYGLPKAVWDDFNFEEGLSSVNEAKRHRYLMQQALVASSGNLQGEVLGL